MERLRQADDDSKVRVVKQFCYCLFTAVREVMKENDFFCNLGPSNKAAASLLISISVWSHPRPSLASPLGLSPREYPDYSLESRMDGLDLSMIPTYYRLANDPGLPRVYS